MAVFETSPANSHEKTVVTESVGVFDGYNALFETIKDLGSQGFGRHQISVRGSDAALRENFGNGAIGPQLLEDNPDAPRSPIIGAEELGIAQGVLVGASIYLGAAIAMVITDGLAAPDSISTLIISMVLTGLAGTLLARILGWQYRLFFQKQANTGGLVLWVETPDDATRRKAETILKNHGAHDVHTHQMAIAA